MSGNNKTLVLGLGNDILMDDGVGPKLMRVVAEQYPFPDFDYDTAALGGMELIEMMRDYSRIIIIDAIMTRGGIPGAVYHLTPANFKETSHISNLHDISFLTALKMAESLDIYISDKIDIIAVEIVEDRVFGEEFTPELAANYEETKTEVLAMIKELLGK